MLRRQLEGIADPRTPRQALILSVVGILLLSVPAFCTRFLNDMDYYSLVADKLLRGGLLYRDAIDTKPPLVFLHYAAIFKLFGQDNLTAVKIVTMACLGASAFLVQAIYRELFPRSTRPELAALLFVVASFSGWGEDFLSSNTEILSNLFVLIGVLCMVKDGFSSRPSRLLLAGACVGVAFLYRYQAGAALAAYFFTIVGLPKLFDRRVWRLLWLGIGWSVPLVAIVAYYQRIGGLQDLAFLVQYQWFYVRKPDFFWPQVFGQAAIVLLGQGPFILLAGSQVLRTARRRAGERDVFLLWFLAFSVLPFFIGGHYFAHYIVQAIPAFVLLATERLDSSATPSDRARPDTIVFKHARALILATVMVFWIVNTAYYAARHAEPPSPGLAGFVRARTSPGDSVFVWTQRRHILFEVDRVYATRFLSNEFLTGRIYGSRHRQAWATVESAKPASVPELWPELLHDLEAEKPRLIVDDAPDWSNFTIDRYPQLASFVRAHYEPGQMMDGFCVYIRKAG